MHVHRFIRPQRMQVLDNSKASEKSWSETNVFSIIRNISPTHNQVEDNEAANRFLELPWHHDVERATAGGVCLLGAPELPRLGLHNVPEREPCDDVVDGDNLENDDDDDDHANNDDDDDERNDDEAYNLWSNVCAE